MDFYHLIGKWLYRIEEVASDHYIHIMQLQRLNCLDLYLLVDNSEVLEVFLGSLEDCFLL